MQFVGLAVGVAIVALLILALGVRILVRGNWVLAWLRGSLGLGIVVLAALFGLLAYDFSTYKQSTATDLQVQVSIKQSVDQRFELSLSRAQQVDTFVVEGDLWRLDVRELGWQGAADAIGLQPGYRLDRVKTRFSDSRLKQPIARYSQARLEPSTLNADLWLWAYKNRSVIGLIAPKLLKSNYYPLTDGAEFQVRLAGQDLELFPLNDIAERALKVKRQ